MHGAAIWVLGLSMYMWIQIERPPAMMLPWMICRNRIQPTQGHLCEISNNPTMVEAVFQTVNLITRI